MSENIYVISKLEFQLLANVQDVTILQNNATVTFNSGFDFEEIDFVKGSANFSVNQERSNLGIVYNNSISFKIADRNITLDNFIEVPVIIKVTLTNNKVLLLGDLDKPVILKISHNNNIITKTSQYFYDKPFVFLS